MYGGTGVITQSTSAADVKDFFMHSNFNPLAIGSFGYTLTSTLWNKASVLDDGRETEFFGAPSAQPPRQVRSKFQHLDKNLYGQDVRKLVAKLCFIGEPGDMLISSDNKKMSAVQAQSFLEEIAIQKDIYRQTMQYLMPLCPAIVFGGIFNKSNDNQLLQTIYNRCNDPYPIAPMVNTLYEEVYQTAKGSPQYGIIVMELADGYTNYSNVREKAVCDVYAALLTLAQQCGYNHGDFHGRNILVKPSAENKKHYDVLLIDFGLTSKLSPDERQEMDLLYNNGNFLDALRLLCSRPRKDGARNSGRDIYKYVCDPMSTGYFSSAEELNRKVAEALSFMQQRTAATVEEMQRRRDALLAKAKTNPRLQRKLQYIPELPLPQPEATPEEYDFPDSSSTAPTAPMTDSSGENNEAPRKGFFSRLMQPFRRFGFSRKNKTSGGRAKRIRRRKTCRRRRSGSGQKKPR